MRERRAFLILVYVYYHVEDIIKSSFQPYQIFVLDNRNKIVINLILLLCVCPVCNVQVRAKALDQLPHNQIPHSLKTQREET